MSRRITYVAALGEALRQEMARDPTVVSYGEGVERVGDDPGSVTVTSGLTAEFGVLRNFDSPISETAMCGGAVGMAITGLRPVVDLQSGGFFAVAMDEIYFKAAKWRFLHGPAVSVPVVFRFGMGAAGAQGPEHSECPEAHFMNCPGIKIAVPFTPYDAKGLLIAAIRDDNPVLFLQHRLLLGDEGEVPEEAYVIPFGKAQTRRAGNDVTVVVWSRMIHTALAAAQELAAEGVDVEVIDPRTLVPLDREAILASAAKTRRVVIVHEAAKTGGAGAEIAAIIAEEIGPQLAAPIRRVAALDVPITPSDHVTRMVIPQVADVVAAVHDVMRPTHSLSSR